MANDRVMMRCDGCGAWKMFLKHYPGDLSTYTARHQVEFLCWVDAHCACHPDFNGTSLKGNPGFSLWTEGTNELDPDKQNAPPP